VNIISLKILDLLLPPKISTSFSSEESFGQWTSYHSSLESFFEWNNRKITIFKTSEREKMAMHFPGQLPERFVSLFQRTTIFF
jgi:hypothetical protein